MSKAKILKASAGSGKTYRLAYEYVKNVVLEPQRYKYILAVTFTNKATKEMKTRILDEIDSLKYGKGFMQSFVEDFKSIPEFSSKQDTEIRDFITRNAYEAQRVILHDYSNFSVMTIDKFFQRIYRAFCSELGLNANFKIGLNDSYFLSLAIDNMIDNFQNDPVLAQNIEKFNAERLNDNKKFNFKDDILKISNNILSKDFDRDYYIDHIEEMGLIFDEIELATKKSTKNIVLKAQQLMDFFNKNSLDVSDFNQSSRGLYPFVEKFTKGEFKAPNSYVAKMIEDENAIGSKKGRGGNYKTEIHTMLNDLYSVFLTEYKKIATYEAVLKNRYQTLFFVNIAKEFDNVSKTNNTVLLSSSVKVITALIARNDTPYIYEKIGCRYDILMIDEFQDTSFDQWTNFVPLVQNSLSVFDKDFTSVTLVGDVKQSIYAWRGGDWRILEHEVSNSINKDVLEIETLDTNWRSHKNIVNFNNLIVRAFVEHSQSSIDSQVNDFIENENLNEEFKTKYKGIVKRIYTNMEQKISPKNIDTNGYIEWYPYDGKSDAADNLNLAETVKVIEDAQKRGYKPSDIAILVRKKAEVKKITDYINTYKNSSKAQKDVSYELTSRDGLLLSNSSVVMFIINCYRLVLDNKDVLALAYYNTYLNFPLTRQLCEEDIAFFDSLLSISICESFEKILAKYTLQNDIAYIQALHDKVIEFSRDMLVDISHFVDYWNEESSSWAVSLPPQSNSMRIETIHAVKGLEFDVVIVPYCDWTYTYDKGTLWASDINISNEFKFLLNKNKDLAETNFADSYITALILETIESFNIFYVAVTRAAKELYMYSNISSKAPNIYTTLSTCFDTAEFKVTIKGDTKKVLVGDDVDGKYVFGLKDKVLTEDFVECVYTEAYPAEDYTNRAIIRHPNDKYFEEMSEGVTLRKKGILKHRVFENIKYLDDIDDVIQKMSLNGEIEADEVNELREDINQILNNEKIESWFSHDWEVKNEQDILVFNENYKIFRPDRVIVSGDKAIVIDYKFGEKNKAHHKQVKTYMSLLSNMGYKNVEGYIWYITNHIVDKV